MRARIVHSFTAGVDVRSAIPIRPAVRFVTLSTPSRTVTSALCAGFQRSWLAGVPKSSRKPPASTTIAADPLTPSSPVVAVTVVLPSPVAVTRPVSSTITTVASLDVHVTTAPVITWPFWSSTRAVNCAVCPRDASVAVAGDTVIDVATGGGGGGGATGSSSPQESVARRTRGAAMRRRPAAFPEAGAR